MNKPVPGGKARTRQLAVDRDYLVQRMLDLLAIPSPTGMTDRVVAWVCEELESLGIPFELTRRGAIRADIRGETSSPDRAIVSHLDVIGAMVKELLPGNRLQVVPIGTWSARFAEGARVTVYADDHRSYRGTLLPKKASGHVYNEDVDKQPVSWDNLECRLDEVFDGGRTVADLGIQVGDHIAVDTNPEVSPNGFINSRHLDDKAGVAAVLAAARAVTQEECHLPFDVHLLFTISEEVGVGASHVLHGDVSELISIDNGTLAPGQNTAEFGVTVAMQDSSGPFDWHLSRHLLELCRDHDIIHARDVFRYYRSDAAAALEAGNDIRTALLCFGLDASHGYERTHLDSLMALANLLTHYMQSPALFERDDVTIGPVGDLLDKA